MPRFFLAAAAFLVAFPTTAVAGVRIESRDTALSSGRAGAWSWRALPVQAAPYRFNMAGVHWRGSGAVFLRTAKTGGEWSPWLDASAEEGDAPDRGSVEATAGRGWKLGAPIWVGPSDRIQLNVAGEVRRLRTFFIASPVERVAPARVARTARPAIIRRSQWGADESIVRARPSYADRIAFAVVHHTAGAQPSSPGQSAAIVRGIQTYHVEGNGWNDIGYNFLVDRFGQIFEGRGGGIAANVVGAHAQGFNTGSVGVSVLGTFSSAPIGWRSRRALVRLLAWRLDLAHVNPTSRRMWTSGGNPEYPAGTRVRLRAVSGHRDTGPTTCPGSALYARLPSLASAIRARGRPKIYAPRATGALGGPVRFRAGVDPAGGWTVTVMDGSGATVASGAGTGDKIDWMWGSAGAPAGTYRWVIAAGAARAATGLLGSGGVPPPAPWQTLRFRSAGRSVGVISPDGDGHKDGTVLSWRTNLTAEVKIVLLDSAGRVVAQVMPWRIVPATRRTKSWNGAGVGGHALPDGAYTLRFRARAGAQRASKELPVTLDRTLGFVRVSPRAFSPNGDGARDVAKAAFRLGRDAQVRVTVRPEGAARSTVFEGRLSAGAHVFPWKGKLESASAPDGRYTLTVSATTRLGTRRRSRSVRLDTRAPVLSGVTAARTSRATRVKFTLDEASRTTIKYGRRLRVVVAGKVGPNVLWRRVKVERVQVRSRDAAGNESAAVRVPVR